MNPLDGDTFTFNIKEDHDGQMAALAYAISCRDYEPDIANAILAKLHEVGAIQLQEAAA